MAQQDLGLPEVQFDATNLYQEDVFTDRTAGTLRRLRPIKVDGTADESRPIIFEGQTQLMTPGGVLPLGFEIEAATLQEAIDKFSSSVHAALRQRIEEAREYQRESASRIVVPEGGAALGAGLGTPPGGGKIKF